MNPCTFFIYESVNSISSSIYIQWIPGHSDIPGNELVDKAVKEAIIIVTSTILYSPVSLSSSLQVINDKICDNPSTHKWVTWIYQHGKGSCDSKQVKSSQDDLLLARLRSNQHPSLHEYLNQLDPAKGPICPLCQLKELSSVSKGGGVL